MSTKNTKPSALALQSATAIMLRLRDFNRIAKDYAAGGGIITAQQMQTYDGRAQIVMNLRDEIAAEVDRALAKTEGDA